MIEQIVTIPVGAQGIDYAWWRPSSGQLAPWAFAVRYFCKLPNGKAATVAEIATIHAAGVAFLGVWEQGAADWEQGAPKGHEQGQLAAQFAASVGYPHGLPILAAFDTNAVAGDARAIAYGNAFADEVNDAGYDFGPYADLDVIRVLANRSGLNWLAGARAWSSTGPLYRPETMPGYELVHVRQTISGSTPNYDNNVVLRPFPAWLPHEVPAHIEAQPTTPPTEDDMPSFTHADNDHDGHPPRWTFWFLMPDGTKRHLSGVELDGIRGDRTNAPALPMADIDTIPDYQPAAGGDAPRSFTINLSGTAQA